MQGNVIRLSRLRLTAACSSRVMKSCSGSPAMRGVASIVGVNSDIHLADEIAGRQRGCVLHQRLDATALGVTEHDDVLHAQHLHAEFQRRRYAVRGAVRRVGRDDVGDVADDEQFAGSRIEDHLRRHAANRSSRSPSLPAIGRAPTVRDSATARSAAAAVAKVR